MSIRYPDSVGIAFSRPAAGTGYPISKGRFGKVAKCPHCEATDIEKKCPGQITCGSISCREKQNRAKAKAKKKERKARAIVKEYLRTGVTP